MSYKEHHSTETLIVFLHNDILSALDENKAVCVLCIDLRVVFDMVDHSILLDKIQKWLGIGGLCLTWFKSYLSNRKQTMVIHGVNSISRDHTCDVPQGSVLGPKFYNVYTLPLDEVKMHTVEWQLYADDGLLYVTFKEQTPDPIKTNMEDLITDLKGFFPANNQLSINWWPWL